MGAREFLIAWNIVLDSDDLAAAKAIAGEIREANGGLPSVKAPGASPAVPGQGSGFGSTSRISDVPRCTSFTSQFGSIVTSEESASQAVN